MRPDLLKLKPTQTICNVVFTKRATPKIEKRIKKLLKINLNGFSCFVPQNT